MPIYEYLCGECEHELEALQKISDDPLVYCPECGAKTLKKKISPVAFRLKGTGWYETDFKDNDKKKSAGQGKETSAASAGSSKDSRGAKDTKDTPKNADAKPDAKSGAND